MSNINNIPTLIKHVLNGTFGLKFCRICLLPLEDFYEDIFTKICKEKIEYCVADILEEVCRIKIDTVEEFKVCPKCFVMAGETYKFYLQTLQNQEILNYYVDRLSSQVNITIPEHFKMENICVSLPAITPQINTFNYDLLNHPFKKLSDLNEKLERNKNQLKLLEKKAIKKEVIKKQKLQRNRGPMAYKMCSKCPVRYRFVRKLQEHMKEEHGVTLFVCQVCRALIEDEYEYKIHLSTHTDVHTCEHCNVVFKKRSTIIAHLKWHEETNLWDDKKIKQFTYICEVCGVVLASEGELVEHRESKHAHKYTCYYCGRRYKIQVSFEMHIMKHEMHMKGELKNAQKVTKTAKKNTCTECGKSFVDERSLLWHGRLHAGEKPYECQTCGRRFVSINRRNQHALCSHTAPTRQCPLCPSLFHLRSMVNTHIKRVHLRTNKRRNRHCKKRDVFWKTETVPLQELSVSVQNEVLKLKTANK